LGPRISRVWSVSRPAISATITTSRHGAWGFSTLLTNAVIFHTTLDMMMVLRELLAEGWTITPEDLAVLSPYLTARIQRFGVYATDEITLTPDAYEAHLGVDLAETA
jgi:Tn3 transposase DDE domain